MAITVNLYSFSKRENSTKRPTSGATSYSCTLIDDTSLMNPIFKLEIGSNPIGKNYCYVPDFDRYYFISNIRSFQNFWYIECKCDVLASYRNTIGAQTHYVIRAASEYDEGITDGSYIAKTIQGSSHQLSGSTLSWSSGHSYIIGITGFSSQIANSQTGSVTYYQFNDYALYQFLYYLMRDISNWCDIQAQEYSDPGIQEALINPMQYIVSCIALPIKMQNGSSGTEEWSQARYIDFGYYRVPESAIYPSGSSADIRIVPRAAVITEHADISIPKHPQASTRGKYLNGAPYSDYIFHNGPWGDIPLEPAALIDYEYLYYEIAYDVCQGLGRLLVTPKGPSGSIVQNILYCGYAQVGAPIQISQAIVNAYERTMNNITDMNAALSTALGTAPAIIQGFNASGIGQLNTQKAKIVYDAVVSKYPTVTNSGSNGSMLSFTDIYKCYLTHKYLRVVDEDLEEIGRPLYQMKQLNTLTGYVLCENADAAITGTQEEAQQINAYLNSGFFME